MKKFIVTGAIFCSLISCEVAQQIAGEIILPTEQGESKLTNSEVISGLKEALNIAINNSSSLASKLDGFNGNNLIRLPFPQDAIRVKEFLDDKGLLQNQIAKFETTLNRAAEDASKTAGPIFIDAIKNMSIQDGFTILKGGEGAATKFLKEKTTAQLIAAFSPIAKASMDKVELTKQWSPLADLYNKSTILTGKEKVNSDLDEYVTNKAIDGLFTLMAQEENKIRKDPTARVTDILKKVFSTLDK
ncbi:MAG: DUF4197 domain-containing protein [Flavobacteriales bacterium]|jgi:hypothetical protein